MRQLVRESCDFLMALPMRGKIESLNAAVAGSIAIYLTLFEREKKKTRALRINSIKKSPQIRLKRNGINGIGNTVVPLWLGPRGRGDYSKYRS